MLLFVEQNSSYFIAFIGGIFFNFVQFVEYSKLPRDKRPNFKDWVFWVPYFGWPFGGPVLVFLHDGELTRQMAFYLGLSAPLIIKTAVKTAKSETVDPGDGA